MPACLQQDEQASPAHAWSKLTDGPYLSEIQVPPAPALVLCVTLAILASHQPYCLAPGMPASHLTPINILRQVNSETRSICCDKRQKSSPPSTSSLPSRFGEADAYAYARRRPGQRCYQEKNASRLEWAPQAHWMVLIICPRRSSPSRMTLPRASTERRPVPQEFHAP